MADRNGSSVTPLDGATGVDAYVSTVTGATVVGVAELNATGVSAYVTCMDGTTLYPPSSGATTFVMRAWHTPLARHVYWAVTGQPDSTGAQSGYTPADLSDILIVSREGSQ
jgi:hypothetical protein